MEKKYGDLFDYLDWRGDLTFQQSNFNVVDGLIFSVFSYIEYTWLKDIDGKEFGKVVGQLDLDPANDLFKCISVIRKKGLEFVNYASHTRRFANVKLYDAVDILCEKTEEQFAAVTFLLPDNTLFLSFRGTDNSLIGWKEDFNMSFLYETPAQVTAARYAQKIADEFQLPMRLGGHSKGGNLAVWAASHLSPEAKERVLQVYNNDGPGFRNGFLESREYMEIENKVLSFVPESSIVGVLMGHCDYLTIKSTNHTIMQHDPFSWKVLGRRFEYDIERSKSGRKLEKTINGMISSMSQNEIQTFVEKIYSILTATNAATIDDLEKNKLKLLFFTLPKIIKAKKDISKLQLEG